MLNPVRLGRAIAARCTGLKLPCLLFIHELTLNLIVDGSYLQVYSNRISIHYASNNLIF